MEMFQKWTAGRMSWLAGLVGWVVILASSEAAQAASAESLSTPENRSWPHWRGSGSDSVARGEGTFGEPFDLRVRWRSSLGSGYSGVVVADGYAVTLFSDGQLDYVGALDADTGAERWRFPIGATFPGREGANDGPVSTPAISGNAVFALGPWGDLVAVHLDSGELLWRTQLVDRFEAVIPHWGFSTSPLPVGDILVVQTGGPDGRAITGFDAGTGDVRWQIGDDNISYQSPVLMDVDGQEQLIAAGDSALLGLEPRTGELKWRYDHGGESFFRKVFNPVAVGDRRLLLTQQRESAVLIDLGASDVGGRRTAIREKWTTPDLKLNYAPPIHHEGYLYGYSGSFLSCVDASNGQLVWKSRPPGNGFPILVDGHLVTLTKRGTLHVAEATPAGYREKKALEVFAHLVWTPPAFADGRVYARDSFDEVVSVEIVESQALQASPESEGADPLGVAFGSKFARWIESVERSKQPQRLVDQRFAEQETLPIIEGDRWAHFVFRGPADDLVLRANMLEIRDELPMRQVPGTDLCYASFELEADARINYQFVRDLDAAIPDPENPNRSPSIVVRGEVSQLLMPGAARPPKTGKISDLPRGRIESFTLETEKVQIGARTWGGPREISVYLPAGYEATGDRQYPVLYFLYGEQMLQQVGWSERLDGLVDSRIQPVIAVFVEAISAYEYARSQRGVHGDMLVQQLIPRIDERYRTLTGDRAIAGVDEAAYGALETALRYPQAFDKVLAQSVLPIGKGGDELLNRIATVEASFDVYLDWGRYDQRDSRDGTDVPGFGRRLRAALEKQGYRVIGREWNDGSDLLFWAWRLTEGLEAFYGSQP